MTTTDTTAAIISINEARQIIAELTLPAMPAGWIIDRERMAKAYKQCRKAVSHEQAVSYLTYYLHHFRAYSNA